MWTGKLSNKCWRRTTRLCLLWAKDYHEHDPNHTSRCLHLCCSARIDLSKTMTTESIKQLIDLCRAGQCAVTLAGCQTGVVAEVTATRGEVFKQTSVYLDSNDKENGPKLAAAVQRVQ